MTTPSRLSALVVARNEAKQLGDCLTRLTFADEIVVVLDRSTDASKAIALGFGAKVIEGAWEIEGERRKAGQDACTGYWILEIDADERVMPDLASEIRSVLASKAADIEQPDFYRIPIDNYIGNRLVRYGWGAQYGVSAKIILYRRGVKSWGNQRVHPKVKMQGVNGGALTQRLAHYVDEDISDMIHRLDRYTTLNGQDLAYSGRAGTFRKNIARIFGRFWKCFVLRKGYREGGLGFIIALFAGLYPILSYLKSKEIEGKSK